MNSLPRIRAGLLRHSLDKQVLIYDSRDGLVHLLDPATACVLELLEEGGRSAAEITSQIGIRLDIAPNPEFLPLAMDELRKANLLDLSEAGPLEPLVDVNRREMIRKLAMTGAAALLVPAVATLTATPGYAQTITGTLEDCSSCIFPTDCVSGICSGGVCGGGNKTPNGGVCSGNGNCCSNNCVITAGHDKGLCGP